MNIKKPNSFARYGSDYVAPLTTIDQIVKPSGERYTDKEFELMSNVENVMFGENCAGKNLLRPTLPTTTINGVTCTNNGDGTYTLNGTATNEVYFNQKVTLKKGTYNIPYPNTDSISIAYGSKWKRGVFELTEDTSTNFFIYVASGTTLNNLIVKPMITDDLTATYDDFEPYVKSLKQLTNSALNMDLLWTNASPNSAFAEQTISLDLSEYKAVYILSKYSDDVSSFMYDFLVKYNFNKIEHSSIDTGKVYYREINISNAGVYFGNCFAINNYGSSDVVQLSILYIPYQIYGVR